MQTCNLSDPAALQCYMYVCNMHMQNTVMTTHVNIITNMILLKQSFCFYSASYKVQEELILSRMFDEGGTVFRLVTVLTVKNARAHAQ